MVLEDQGARGPGNGYVDDSDKTDFEILETQQTNGIEIRRVDRKRLGVR